MADVNQVRIFVSHSHEDDDYCHALVAAFRAAEADVWYDEHNFGSGELINTIERELRTRPIFVLLLTNAALHSSWVQDECKWAYTLLRRDNTRIILPVLGQANIDMAECPLYLQDFRRIEAPGMRPYPREEAIWRTLKALALPQPVTPSETSEPQSADTFEELLATGLALFARQRFDTALTYFERAVAQDPDNAEGWIRLCNANFNLKRYVPALSAIARATTIAPRNASAWIITSDILTELGRYSEALNACATALSVDPDNSNAWASKGYALNRLSRYVDALTAFERSTTLDPRNEYAWKNKAFSLRALGRAREAAAAERHALSLRA